MIEKGEIYRIKKDGFAVVRFPRKTACENCHMCFKPKEEMYVELNVKNTIGAKEGDSVVVEMRDSTVILSSFVVYFIPLVVLCAVVAITYKLETWITIVSSLGALLFTFIIVSVIDRFVISKKSKNMAKIVSIENLK